MNVSARVSVTIFFFVNGLIFASWASRIPDLQSAFSLDNSKMGFVLLAHSIGAFVSMPFTGILIQKIGSKFVSLYAAIAFITFFVLIGLAPSYIVLMIVFFMTGSATGIMDVAMNSQAVIVEHEYHKPIMTFFHAMFSIGMVVGGLVGSYFVGYQQSISTHLLFIAALSIIMVLYGYRSMLGEPPQSLESKTKSRMRPSLPIIALGIIALCCMIGEGAMSDWSTNYLKNILQTSPSYTTFGLTAFAGSMTIGRLFGDKGRALWGDSKLLSFGSLMALAGMILIMSTYHFIIVILGFALVGLGLSNIVPIAFSIAGNLKGITPGVGISMVSTIGYTGFMFGPPLIGFIADAYDLRVAFGLLILLFVLMMIIISSLKRSNKVHLVQ